MGVPQPLGHAVAATNSILLFARTLGEPLELAPILALVGVTFVLALLTGAWVWFRARRSSLPLQQADDLAPGPPLTWERAISPEERLVDIETLRLETSEPAEAWEPSAASLDDVIEPATQWRSPEPSGAARPEKVPRLNSPPPEEAQIAARPPFTPWPQTTAVAPAAPVAVVPLQAAATAKPRQAPTPISAPQAPASRPAAASAPRSAAANGNSLGSRLPRGRRLFLEVPVSIQGSRLTALLRGQAAGGPFREDTRTLMLLPTGAVVQMVASVAQDEKLILTNKQTGKDVVCRVVNVQPGEGGKNQVEIEFAQAALQFWGVSFPQDVAARNEDRTSGLAASQQPVPLKS